MNEETKTTIMLYIISILLAVPYIVSLFYNPYLFKGMLDGQPISIYLMHFGITCLPFSIMGITLLYYKNRYTAVTSLLILGIIVIATLIATKEIAVVWVFIIILAIMTTAIAAIRSEEV